MWEFVLPIDSEAQLFPQQLVRAAVVVSVVVCLVLHAGPPVNGERLDPLGSLPSHLS